MSKKTETQFIDTSKETKNMMIKLAKDGLKAGGKVVTKILREKINQRTGGLRKAITAWAKIDRDTGQPYMDIGYRNRAQMKKRGVKYVVNPCWFEFGVKPHIIMTKSFSQTGKSTYQLQSNGQKYGVKVQHPGLSGKNLLRNTVYENINEINKAQEESLKQLTDLMIEQGANIDTGGDEEIE